MPIITEIPSEELLDRFVREVDIIQVGARNMQNFHLLKALGKIRKPVLLKRGMAATIEEWLMAAEYILAGGNDQVILCERGIRTFEKYTRNTLDLSAVLAVKELSHLPVVVDPSHATGRWQMVEDLSKAALAVGADGIIVEVHNNPACALCDGAQSLRPDRFDQMMDQLKNRTDHRKEDGLMNIAIIGLGLMGSSYAMALSKAGHTVYGIDRDPEAVRLALAKNGFNSVQRI